MTAQLLSTMLASEPVGILNVNKPPGMTSRRVVDIVCRAARTRRAGHAGTLDPLARGVLLVCLGWATRLVPYVQSCPKRYRAEFLLGRTSDTDDVSGTVMATPGATPPARDTIERELAGFVGPIQQVPPRFSAVHVEGERAYRKAREGEELALSPREVTVYRLELCDYAWPRLELLIECGSGTYVRSIGRDLGERLGCGAVMSALLREAIGRFTVETAVELDELNAESLPGRLLPPVEAVRHLPIVICQDDALEALARGKAITARGTVPQAGPVAITDGHDRLLAMGEPAAGGGLVQPRKVFV